MRIRLLEKDDETIVIERDLDKDQEDQVSNAEMLSYQGKYYVCKERVFADEENPQDVIIFRESNIYCLEPMMVVK